MVDLHEAGRQLREGHLGPATPVEELARRVSVRRRRRRVRRAFAALLVAAGLTTLAVRGDGQGSVSDVATHGPDSTPPTTVGPTVPALVGLDYAEAQARAASAGIGAPATRVLLALDVDAGQPLGVVTRTEPAAGEPVDAGQLVIYVSATIAEAVESNGASGAIYAVSSHGAYPPEGLVVGVATPGTNECDSYGESLQDVRFLRGELVGCFGYEFIWLDRLQDQQETTGRDG